MNEENKNFDVIWSPGAKTGFDSNLDYIKSNFGINSAMDFISRIKKCEDILIKFPYAGALDEDLGCRKLLVVKQVYLLYSVERITKEIYILSLWNNYQKPFWL